MLIGEYSDATAGNVNESTHVCNGYKGMEQTINKTISSLDIRNGTNTVEITTEEIYSNMHIGQNKQENININCFSQKTEKIELHDYTIRARYKNTDRQMQP